MPYLATRARSQEPARDPVTTRYVAQLIESVGVDRVLSSMCTTSLPTRMRFAVRGALEANRTVIAHLAPLLAGNANVAVVSPTWAA